MIEHLEGPSLRRLLRRGGALEVQQLLPLALHVAGTGVSQTDGDNGGGDTGPGGATDRGGDTSAGGADTRGTTAGTGATRTGNGGHDQDESDIGGATDRRGGDTSAGGNDTRGTTAGTGASRTAG